MYEAFVNGLLLVFAWPSIGFLFSGILMGIAIGAIPGLGGIVGLFILLPFTYGMEPVPAFALLLGMFAVTTTSDTIASVMLGIPGTAASQATIIDGYPMAKKGQAGRALGAAFSVSAFGGVFGVMVLAISLPIVMPIILAFGSPEMFMFGILGLTMVGSLSGGSILKGLIVALLGLLMSTIGYAESFAIPRYAFGTDYLIDGLGLLPVVLGLFAIPELMDLALKNTSISRISKDEIAGGGILDGVKDALDNWWLVIRCSTIGTYIGMLPGLGAGIVDWIAYGHAVQSAKDSSQFGKGDIRGVIAPEAANITADQSCQVIYSGLLYRNIFRESSDGSVDWCIGRKYLLWQSDNKLYCGWRIAGRRCQSDGNNRFYNGMDYGRYCNASVGGKIFRQKIFNNSQHNKLFFLSHCCSLNSLYLESVLTGY